MLAPGQNPLEKYLPQNASCSFCVRAHGRFDLALESELAAFGLDALLELNIVEADAFMRSLHTDVLCQLGYRLAAAGALCGPWCACSVGRFHTYALCITDIVDARAHTT